MIWKILDKEFYRNFNVFNPEVQYLILNDIKKELEDGKISKCVPPHQTIGNIYERHNHIEYWKRAYQFFKSKTEEFKGRKVKLYSSWGNMSDEENDYRMHTHDKVDVTCVYYIKGLAEVYGTNIDNKIIIPFIENSSLIFEGKIPHSIINMPHDIASKKMYHRYTLVFDFNYV